MRAGDVVRLLSTGNLALVERASKQRVLLCGYEGEYAPSDVGHAGHIMVGKSRPDGGSANRKVTCLFLRGLEDPIRCDVITHHGRDGCTETRKGEIRKMAFERLVALSEGRGE